MRIYGINMRKKLDDYIMIFRNQIDDSICEQTIEQLNSENWTKNTFKGYKNEEVSLSKNELDVCYADIPTKGILMMNIYGALQKYFQQLNFSWFNGWDGYTTLRFNRYNEGQEMSNHCDHITINEDGLRKGVPILSVIGVLNDDYEGGEFVIFNDEIIELKKGDIMIFPSSFLYPHHVKPVTKGVRNTFVSWVW